VINPSASLNGSLDSGSVANVRKKNLDGRRQVVNRGSGPLDDADRLAGINQVIHQVAADKPCPAGHDRKVARFA
jgi:hypothetical protein